MNTFRLQLRFLVPLVLTLVAAGNLAVPLMDRLTLRGFSRDLDLRGARVANALSDSIAAQDNRNAMSTSAVSKTRCTKCQASLTVSRR